MAKKVKGKVKPLKKKKPTKKKKGKKRAPNNYFQIRSAVSKYCKEKFGKPCPEKEMRRIYYDVKRRFFPNTPISEVLSDVNAILSNKDGDKVPANVLAFPWYDIEDTLVRGDGLFFRADDSITLDLSVLDMGVIETTFGELPMVYRDEIYPTLRNRTYEIEARNLAPSPMPEFTYNSKASNIEERKFVWGLKADFNRPKGFVFEGTYTARPQGMRSIPQKGVKSDAVLLEELKNKNAELRAKELSNLKQLYDDKIITREEYAQLVKGVYDKFSLGGVVD
jgi:hypothetical protein